MTPHDICIDVSHWQAEIDWPRVFDGGIRIAMVKASEGTRNRDSHFPRNYARATSAGLAVIPYHFLRPGAVKEQIANFRAACGISHGDLVALDWEGRASEAASPAEVEQIGTELAALTGRPPLGYWGIPGSTPGEPTGAMKLWPRWVARYPTAGAARFDDLPERVRQAPNKYWPGSFEGELPHFAQYTKWGQVPGIAGNCDRSVAFFPSAVDASLWVQDKDPGIDYRAPAVQLGTEGMVGSAHPAPDTADLDDDIRDAVKRVQARLMQRGGLYKGKIDGDPGPLTLGALAAWRLARK